MTGRLTRGASPTVTCGLREIDMTDIYHQPDAGASPAHVDQDNLAHLLLALGGAS